MSPYLNIKNIPHGTQKIVKNHNIILANKPFQTTLPKIKNQNHKNKNSHLI